MMKSAIAIGLFVAVGSLPAQEPAHMHANIPFDFRLGQKVLPSGEYLVQMSGPAVIFRQEDGRLIGAVALTNPDTRSAAPQNGELRFNRYGNEYFLASLWTPYSPLGRALMKTKQEKYVARHASGSVETASVGLK
jgi:hypothetical protein